MLKLLQTKTLFAILAALVVIAGAAIYQQHEAHKASLLREQQLKQNEKFRKQVEQLKKQHNSAAGKEGNTWRTYIP